MAGVDALVSISHKEKIIGLAGHYRAQQTQRLGTKILRLVHYDGRIRLRLVLQKYRRIAVGVINFLELFACECWRRSQIEPPCRRRSEPAFSARLSIAVQELDSLDWLTLTSARC